MDALPELTLNELIGSRMQFQICALAIYSLLLFNYIRTKKLPILSTYAFSLMMFFSGVNLIFDVITVYTISHVHTVPPLINRIAHQMFIGSLDSVIYCLALYIFFLVRQKKGLNRLWLLPLSIPYILSMLVVAFGTLEYFNDGQVFYSFGMMANSVYIEICIYMLFINVYIIKENKIIDNKTRDAIHAGTLIWIFIALIQGTNHEMLISSLGVSLMLLFIYLSFVNPGEMLDKETGAFTRYAFNLMLSDRLSRRGKCKFYVVGLAFEDMGKINAQIGNENSTRLLAHVTSCFQENLDTQIYHYRGSALAAIVYSNEAILSEKVNCILERCTHHWNIGEIKVYTRCHADIIHCPDFAATADEVYDLLDYMFELQQSDNKKNLQMADNALITKHKRQTAISLLLDKAIKNDGFEVVLQPIYNTKSNAFTSAEALVRLKDRITLGYVGPDEFIPVAESQGMISDLDLTVLRKVCEFASENCLWQKGLDFIEVNLSGVQVIEKGLADLLKSVMDDYGVPPSFINFEVTESVAVKSGSEVHETFAGLKQFGCGTSMDDFGTGYSNLSQLAIVAYDLIKLDKSLIWPCFDEGGENPQVVLSSMINMILRLNRNIVAEGVETQQQADYLIKSGVQHLQGYYYSRPLLPADYLQFMKEHTSA